MRTYLEAKTMARTLRSGLAKLDIDISHSQALELVAAQFGVSDWNVLSARIAQAGTGIAFPRTCPIVRIFDERQAKAFYVDFLGFTLDWEHRFGEGFPLYAQVSREGLSLHLSGHSGDASAGSCTFVAMTGIKAYRDELAGRAGSGRKPAIEKLPWGLVMTLTDPFGNSIRFCEQADWDGSGLAENDDAPSS